MIFTDDKGKEYRFEQPGINVWRSSFDKWFADKAKEASAVASDGAMALSVEDNNDLVSVRLKGKTEYSEKANYVVSCEGVAGNIMGNILKEKPEHITTYQTYNNGFIDLDHHYFYAYLQPELSEYDAWFNVKDNQLVLGVSIKDSRKTIHYHKNFIDYMSNHHGLKITEQING